MHALDEFAEGMQGDRSFLALVLCLLPGQWEPKLLQAEQVEAPQAPRHDSSIGFHPAEQGTITQSVLSPVVCPHGS